MGQAAVKGFARSNPRESQNGPHSAVNLSEREGSMNITITLVALGILGFAFAVALCRAARNGDELMERSFPQPHKTSPSEAPTTLTTAKCCDCAPALPVPERECCCNHTKADLV